MQRTLTFKVSILVESEEVPDSGALRDAIYEGVHVADQNDTLLSYNDEGVVLGCNVTHEGTR